VKGTEIDNQLALVVQEPRAREHREGSLRCAWLDGRGARPYTSRVTHEFLARFLIQIGVPMKPKASRIWFSRKRW
jgi:hypothetical protein